MQKNATTYTESAGIFFGRERGNKTGICSFIQGTG
jgi:hypothetical protein